MSRRKILLPILLTFGLIPALLLICKRPGRAVQFYAARFYTLRDQPVTCREIFRGGSSCILGMDPDCNLCKDELRAILADPALSKETQIRIVILGTPQQAALFSGGATLCFLYDKDQVFTRYFGRHALPCAYIFNRHGVLVKSFQGEVSIAALSAAVIKSLD